MHKFKKLLNPEWWRFEWRYWRKQTPWDTQITPPEVVDFLNANPPGKALDLGCGTGTNAVAMAQRGWRVTGVDFSPKAIAAARRKAAQTDLQIQFHEASVADLGFLFGPFDYALDIGCLFALKPEERQKYAAHLQRLLSPGAHYMLYAWLPQRRRHRFWGISSNEVALLFEPAFKREKIIVGRDSGGGSAWYWFTRR